MIRHARHTKWPPWEAPLANSAEEERQREVDAAMECLTEDIERCRNRAVDPLFSAKLTGMMRRMDYCYDVVRDTLTKDQRRDMQRTMREARVYVAGIGFGSYESDDEDEEEGCKLYDSLRVCFMDDVWTSDVKSFPKMHTCNVVTLCELKGGKVAVMVLADPSQHPQRVPYLTVMPEFQYRKYVRQDPRPDETPRHLDMPEFIDAYNGAYMRAKNKPANTHIDSLHDNLLGIHWAVAELVCRKGAFGQRVPHPYTIVEFKNVYASFKHELMDAQWVYLRDRAGVYLYYCHHARVIQRHFRNAMSNPSHPMCQRRLMREFSELDEP